MTQWLSGWDSVSDSEILRAPPVPNYHIGMFQETLRNMDESFRCEDYHLYHIRRLAESMQETGWVGSPLVVFTDGAVPDGNHRVRAAKLAGVDIPISSAIDREVYYEFYEW